MNALLMLLADGRLPTGGHAVGGGVEWAAGHDDFTNHRVLRDWIVARLGTVGRVEAAFAVAAGHGTADLSLLDDELSARTVGPRARQVSRQTGRQLLRATRRMWSDERLEAVAASEIVGGPHHALVFGTVAAVAGADPVATASLLLHHQVASAVTAVVRLRAEDPIELAAMQASLASTIDGLSEEAPAWAALPPRRLPSNAAPLAEVLAEHHGTWTSRLFVA